MALLLLLFSLNTLAQSNKSPNFSATQMDPEESIIANTESSKNHKMLLAAMRAADLDEILSYDGPFTVFAPSD